jgi:hypothetical protein
VRRVALGADGDGMATERRLVPGVGAAEKDRGEDPDRRVNPQEFAIAKPRESFAEPVLGESLAEDLGDSTRASQAAQGHHHRRESEVGDEIARGQTPAQSD